MNSKTIISGHKNPDVDSIMSAYALAELKHMQGDKSVEAICPGLMPGKAAWLFNEFKAKPIRRRNDVYLRVRDIMNTEYASIYGSKTVLDAVAALRKFDKTTIPVIEKDGTFLGILSPVNLISELLNIDSKSDSSLTGRSVVSSIKKIAKTLKAEFLSGAIDSDLKTYDMFVAAMSLEFFDKHVKAAPTHEPVVIVGDRPEIHLRVLQNNIKLIIITGNCPVEAAVIEMAKAKNVTILRTKYDSATVIRRVKFSTPVRNITLRSDAVVLSPTDMVHDIKYKVMSATTAQCPVCDHDGKLVGIVAKSNLTAPPPMKMIFVDHNELSQAVPGAEELPIVEVVDHHRIGIRPTVEPIRYTCDVVGSTCTIVANMFKNAGIAPAKSTAGLLLSGIVTDTLLFQSPTTTELDKTTAKWLEKLSGVKSDKLMTRLLEIDSPLATMTAHNAINSDRKDYNENGWSFSIAQLEETNLSIVYKQKEKLLLELQRRVASEKLDFFGLIITDAVRGNSVLLYAGNKQIVNALHFKKKDNDIIMMPGVLSRKKQFLPLILSIISELPK